MRNLAAMWLVFGSAALAQPQGTIAEMVAALSYPSIAKSARIQGDVVLVVEAGEVRATAGSPLLMPRAVDGAKLLLPLSRDARGMIFHYVVSDIVLTKESKIEPRGDAFGRFFLRLLHRPTQRMVETTSCEAGPKIGPNRIDVTKAPIEVWVYGQAPCLQSEG